MGILTRLPAPEIRARRGPTVPQRCWKFDWVLDLDIKGFFDNLPWELMIKAVRKHAKDPWVVRYRANNLNNL